MSTTFRRPNNSINDNKRSTTTSVDNISFSSVATDGNDNRKSLKLQLKGTKVWTNGCTLVSTGLRQLDSILIANSSGSIGGQPLGTCICLESYDRFWSSLTNCIVRYWCAESISHDQPLIIPVAGGPDCEQQLNNGMISEYSPWFNNDSYHRDSENMLHQNNTVSRDSILELLSDLPRNINFDVQENDTQQNEAQTHPMASSNQPLDSLVEEQWDEGQEEQDEIYEENLVVAWQYRKDIQQERSGIASSLDEKRKITNTHSTVYCHSYNLQGRLMDQMDIYASVSLLPILEETIGDTRSHYMHFYKGLLETVATSTKPPRDKSISGTSVTRILLYHPDVSLCCYVLSLFLNHIRRHELPVVVMVVLPPSTNDTIAAQQIRRCSDIVLATESFSMRHQYPPPTEFRHLQGLLHIVKLATMTQSTISGHFADRTLQRSPKAVRYGLHRDRRRLNISLLHIPPEDYANDGGSVSAGAVRSGGGRTSKSAHDTKSQLEF